MVEVALKLAPPTGKAISSKTAPKTTMSSAAAENGVAAAPAADPFARLMAKTKAAKLSSAEPQRTAPAGDAVTGEVAKESDEAGIGTDETPVDDTTDPLGDAIAAGVTAVLALVQPAPVARPAAPEAATTPAATLKIAAPIQAAAAAGPTATPGETPAPEVEQPLAASTPVPPEAAKALLDLMRAQAGGPLLSSSQRTLAADTFAATSSTGTATANTPPTTPAPTDALAILSSAAKALSTPAFEQMAAKPVSTPAEAKPPEATISDQGAAASSSASRTMSSIDLVAATFTPAPTESSDSIPLANATPTSGLQSQAAQLTPSTPVAPAMAMTVGVSQVPAPPRRMVTGTQQTVDTSSAEPASVEGTQLASAASPPPPSIGTAQTASTISSPQPSAAATQTADAGPSIPTNVAPSAPDMPQAGHTADVAAPAVAVETGHVATTAPAGARTEKREGGTPGIQDRRHPTATRADTAPDASTVVSAPQIATGPASGLDISSTDAASAPSAADVALQQQLTVDQDGQWLDRLARDITRSASNGQDLRFTLSPPHLGALAVSIAQGADGAAVRMTTDSADTRRILIDSQPRLVAEARAQGLRISETHVDLGNQNNGGSNTPSYTGDRNNGSPQGGNSANAQGGGQQRQPLPDRQPFSRTSDRTRSDTGSSRDSDALYA